MVWGQAIYWGTPLHGFLTMAGDHSYGVGVYGQYYIASGFSGGHDFSIASLFNIA